MRKSTKEMKGITLIALVITVIILLVLAGIGIVTLTGQNGIITKANNAKEENEKQTATEIINLKITNTQIKSYTETAQMPTLQYLADILWEDDEVQYVHLEKQQEGVTKDKIVIGENTSIYTKLKQYPYEFEINNQLQASIDGKRVVEESTGIPEGYMKIPTETLEINENNKTYDVTEYANANVNIKIPEPEPETCNTMTVQFPATGNTCEFDLGYVPSFIFIQSTWKDGYVVWHWSYDSLKTEYGVNNKDRIVNKTSAYSLNGTKIILTTSPTTAIKWNGATLNIYAIK